jgi:hypothetical protein
MMPHGWFKTPRTLLQGPIWSHHNAARLAVYALGAAAWQTTEWKDGRQRLTVPIGAFMTSRSRLATQCGLSQQEVRTGLKKLENHGFIRTRKTKLWTMITLLDPMVCGENEAPANQQPSNQPTQPPKTNQVKNSASDYKQTTCAEPSRTINQAEPKNQPSEPPAKEEGKELLKEGGGDPRFEDAAAAPPRPLAFNPTQPEPPRATVEPPAAPGLRSAEQIISVAGFLDADPIPALVAELATRHDGDVSLSFATKDARAAFEQSGSTDVFAWCETVRQAHARYIADWRSGRKTKPLGYWFLDGVMLKYTDVVPMPKQADTQLTECLECQGTGKVLPKDYELPAGWLDNPDFDPDSYMDSRLCRCPKCNGSGKRLRVLKAVAAAAGSRRRAYDDDKPNYIKRGDW